MKKNPDSNHAKITKENFKKKSTLIQNHPDTQHITIHNRKPKLQNKKKIPPLGQNLEKKRKPRSDLVKRKKAQLTWFWRRAWWSRAGREG